MNRSAVPWRALAGVMLCAAGCSGTAAVAGIQPPFVLPEADPPPVAFDWAGSYTGSMRGEDRGVAFDNLPVMFTISTSREDTVTAHLRITGGPDVFRVCDALITSSSEDGVFATVYHGRFTVERAGP